MHKGSILDASMKVETMSKIASLGKLRVRGKRTLGLGAEWSSPQSPLARHWRWEKVVYRSPKIITQRERLSVLSWACAGRKIVHT